MTNTQLGFGIGIPIAVILASLIQSVRYARSVRAVIRAFRAELREAVHQE